MVTQALIDKLCCPECGAELKVYIVEGDPTNIVEGRLECTTCTLTYPITASIPRLLPQRFRMENTS